MEEDEKMEKERETKNRLLSDIEVKVALEAVKKHKPYGILMDGSLIRYYIYSYDLWMELRNECEEKVLSY